MGGKPSTIKKCSIVTGLNTDELDTIAKINKWQIRCGNDADRMLRLQMDKKKSNLINKAPIRMATPYTSNTSDTDHVGWEERRITKGGSNQDSIDQQAIHALGGSGLKALGI